MHLGMSITPFGHHPAAWRTGRSVEAIGFNRLAAQVAKAQAGNLAFVLLADRFGQRPLHDLSPEAVPFEPTALAAALATASRQIGIIASAATSQHEPYNIARRFASLDAISAGRSGWNLVVSAEALARDKEYVEVVSGLWDSWEEDAFICDKAAGRFFVPHKMHVLDHRGEHFTVRGPLNVNRSPQGKPVIAHKLTLPTFEIAAQYAEVIFIDAPSPEKANGLVAAFARRLHHYGRDRSDVKILADVVIYPGATSAGAQELRDSLDAMAGHVQWSNALQLVGDTREIADRMQQWTQAGIVDGFTILPCLVPESVHALVDHIVPELDRRGLLQRSDEGFSLRDHLGLRKPQHPASQVVA